LKVASAPSSKGNQQIWFGIDQLWNNPASKHETAETSTFERDGQSATGVGEPVEADLGVINSERANRCRIYGRGRVPKSLRETERNSGSVILSPNAEQIRRQVIVSIVSATTWS
jgi:hypothetical protein